MPKTKTSDEPANIRFLQALGRAKSIWPAVYVEPGPELACLKITV